MIHPVPGATTAKDYGQAVPVVITLEQLTEHGAGAAVWRRLGRTGEQTLAAAHHDGLMVDSEFPPLYGHRF